MAALSRRERWVIGLGLTFAVSVAGFLYGVEPLLARQRTAAEMAPAREAALERRRMLIAQRERLAAEQEVLAARLEESLARLLPGPTPPLAAAELQRAMKDAASGAAVEVRSERVLPPIERGGLLEIPIELTVAGSIRETVAFFTQLDRGERLLTVKDVRMRVVAPGQPRELVTTLTLAGYIRSP